MNSFCWIYAEPELAVEDAFWLLLTQGGGDFPLRVARALYLISRSPAYQP